MHRCFSVTIVGLAATVTGLATSCGRFGFDPHEGSASAPPPDTNPADAAPTDAGADIPTGCAVLFRMNESAWIDHGSGAGSAAPGATDLRNACDDGNPGQAFGAPSPIVDQIRGTVGNFNDHSCVQLAQEAPARATAAVTTSAWVRMTGDPANSFGVVSKRVDVNTGNEYSMFVWTDSHVFADIDGINDRFAGPATISTGVWTQITMVYDGSRSQAERVRLYVNGALDQIGGETSATIPQTHSPLSIGCLPLGGFAQSFVGQLDDVGVWTRALSDAEVAAWYDLTRK